LAHPTKIENAVDLAHQMIGWHHLVEIKRIKELALSAFPPTHHEPLPLMPSQSNGITVRESSQWVFCNTIPAEADIGTAGIYEYTPFFCNGPDEVKSP